MKRLLSILFCAGILAGCSKSFGPYRPSTEDATVGSKLDTRAYIGDQLTAESMERPAVKDLRWSLGAGVDVQYQLFTYGALFLQPGFSWHIPNGSELESYYTLHPFSFDFTFGFRFTF